MAAALLPDIIALPAQSCSEVKQMHAGRFAFKLAVAGTNASARLENWFKHIAQPKQEGHTHREDYTIKLRGGFIHNSLEPLKKCCTWFLKLAPKYSLMSSHML